MYSLPHWQRARIAILALELVGTADAKAVLKQLADGHPDILPTKEAKAALARLKKE
jgi:TolA-binding protein